MHPYLTSVAAVLASSAGLPCWLAGYRLRAHLFTMSLTYTTTNSNSGCTGRSRGGSQGAREPPNSVHKVSLPSVTLYKHLLNSHRLCGCEPPFDFSGSATVLCAATDVGMHGLLASQSCYHSVLPPSLCTLWTSSRFLHY